MARKKTACRLLALLTMTVKTMKREHADVEPVERTLSQGALDGTCVLVVDDDADARAILQMWFEYLGCVVVTAESADEAVFLYPRVGPDLVLTDISMPNHDGYWLVRQLRTLPVTGGPPAPVVAMTAFSAMQNVPLESSGRFDDWVPKPISFPELGRTVARLTRGDVAA